MKVRQQRLLRMYMYITYCTCTMYNVRLIHVHCILMYCIPTSFLASAVETLGGCCSLFRSTFSDENVLGEEEEEKEVGPWMAAIARDAGVCIAREIEHHSNYIHVLTCATIPQHHFYHAFCPDIIFTCTVYARLFLLFRNQVMKRIILNPCTH